MCSWYWMNDGTCWGMDKYDECPDFIQTMYLK